MTLSGLEFGLINTTVTGKLALEDCATTSWSSATSVACIGTHGADGTGTAGATLHGVAATSSAMFSFDGQ